MEILKKLSQKINCEAFNQIGYNIEVEAVTVAQF